MTYQEIIEWLLEGDVAIQYQTKRDLLKAEPDVLLPLKKRITSEGWGRDLLSRQQPNAQWGRAFYQPKWTSTHYTLLDLRTLCAPSTEGIRKAIDQVIETCIGPDGGINSSPNIPESDLCICGMFLHYACYFGIKQEKIHSVVNLIIDQQMADGAYNCRLSRYGARHSSLHTTINVLEGLLEYRLQGYPYRAQELMRIEQEARAFLLCHRLFRSDHTGEIIHPAMLKPVFPTRWKYDILRAMEYFQKAGVPYDECMEETLSILEKKRKTDGRWILHSPYPGAVHFTMERPGEPSRWNTLRMLRVLAFYGRQAIE